MCTLRHRPKDSVLLFRKLARLCCIRIRIASVQLSVLDVIIARIEAELGKTVTALAQTDVDFFLFLLHLIDSKEVLSECCVLRTANLFWIIHSSQQSDGYRTRNQLRHFEFVIQIFNCLESKRAAESKFPNCLRLLSRSSWTILPRSLCSHTWTSLVMFLAQVWQWLSSNCCWSTIRLEPTIWLSTGAN